jgi:hypothetical protein
MVQADLHLIASGKMDLEYDRQGPECKSCLQFCGSRFQSWSIGTLAVTFRSPLGEEFLCRGCYEMLLKDPNEILNFACSVFCCEIRTSAQRCISS